MAENLVFGALPLVLGAYQIFQNLYSLYTPNFLTHLIRIYRVYCLRTRLCTQAMLKDAFL